MVTSACKIFGDKVADRCNDVWDLDNEAEIKTVRPLNPPYLSCLHLRSA